MGEVRVYKHYGIKFLWRDVFSSEIFKYLSCFCVSMPKILNSLSIIAEENPSDVFFAVVFHGGSAYPDQIAKKLDMASASVTDNLGKLIKAGIVEMPKKEGKRRLYAVDWKGLAQVACRWHKQHEDSEVHHLMECPRLDKEEAMHMKREVGQLIGKLKQSEEFPQFLDAYFTETLREWKLRPDYIDDMFWYIEDNILDWEKIPEAMPLNRIFRQLGRLLVVHRRLTQEAFFKIVRGR